MILLNSSIGNYVLSNGKKSSYFGGNNYLGLASHPAVKEASIKAIEKYGVNFSASRRTSGTADIHLELERKLSDFKGTQDTVVFASGYLGNSILLEVLRDRYSAIYMDQNAHPSINTAIHGDCRAVYRYKHCDPQDLENLLSMNSHLSPLIITDGIFALTGEIAPLERIYSIAKKYKALIIVDDAHSTGVLGQTGKGTPEYFNLPDDRNIFQSETMSKALGSYGGFISGQKNLTNLIRERSSIYQASTSLPPPVVAAGISSLGIMGENPGLRDCVLKKAGWIREAIISLGFNTSQDKTPIIPVIFPDMSNANSLSSFLEENGVIVPCMNYPSAQGLHMIRIAVTATHTDDQANELIDLLKKWKIKINPAQHEL